MEEDSNSTCTCNMKIIQRQSSSVRYPLTSTFLNMPGSETLNSINSDKLKVVNALFAISVNKDNLNSLNEGIRSLLGDSYGNIRSAYELNTVDVRGYLTDDDCLCIIFMLHVHVELLSSSICLPVHLNLFL